MGGRGSSTGVDANGKVYGSAYKTLLTSGNVKYVVPISGNTTAPMETMTNNRVYVTLDGDGNPKFISYYDRENRRRKQIDLDKPHRGVSPHTHHGYNHNENDTGKGFAHLTLKEKAMVEHVTDIWKGKKSNVWGRWKQKQQSG